MAAGMLLLIACSSSNTVKIGDDLFYVEVADTRKEREFGLMFRESLGNNNGMLFVFNDEIPRTFWMKNTKIPLDIIFIERNGKIVNITTAEPCKEDPCMKYNSGFPAQYVLEINANESNKRGISIGDKVDIW